MRRRLPLRTWCGGPGLRCKATEKKRGFNCLNPRNGKSISSAYSQTTMSRWLIRAARSRISFSLIAATLLLEPVFFLAQAPANGYSPPKTAWGDPDLEGVFTNATVTPFERPAEF